MASSNPSGPLARGAWTALALAAAVGALGAWPRAGVGADPFALVAWATLIALPVGVALGARGVRVWPLGLAPPAVWMIALVQADLAGARDLAEPLWPGVFWTGLYLAGLGLGALRPGDTAAALARAGVALAVVCALAWLGVATGVVTGASGFAAAHPAAQGVLLELSPLAPALDAAGWDWLRANPSQYRLAGAEWVARKPWNGTLAASVAVLVGCTSALLLPSFSRAAEGRGRP